MKNIFIISLFFIASNVFGQFTLLHDYDSSSTFDLGGGGLEDQLMMVNFEVSGDQYVKINRHGEKICIYDMSHTLVKTISYASFPLSTTNVAILYLSEHLFNLDSKKEFMYVAEAASLFTTYIYNEDGLLLFSDTGSAQIMSNEPLQQHPIYNTTSNGTIMILSYRNWHAKVFGLAGTLTTAIDRANTQLVGNGAAIGNPHPNPTNSTTTIEYSLPQGTNQAELVFYNVQGIEVKRFKVDNTFNSLLISTTDIAAGTYYYNLQVGGNASSSKKMVVVK